MQPENFQPIPTPTPPQPPVVPGLDQPANQPEPAQELLGYDASGNPLYGVPASVSQPQNLGSAFESQPQPAAPAEPTVPVRSIEAPRLVDTNPSGIRQQNLHQDVERLHAETVQKYPELNISTSEFVINAIRRHSIGVAAPVAGGIVGICVILAVIFSYPSVVSQFNISGAPSFWIIALIGLALVAMFAGFTYMSVWIFKANRFFLTNESIIQEKQASILSHEEQTISLGNIEDVSYQQTGVLQSLLNYGVIHLGVESKEQAYELTYVDSPREQAAQLTNAVEDFKNGRAVDGQ